MADRSWFFASQGQQHGPLSGGPAARVHRHGTVTADTLVWTEGMADWQKAGDIPGLLSGARARRLFRARACRPTTAAYGGGVALDRFRSLGISSGARCFCDRVAVRHSGALGGDVILLRVVRRMRLRVPGRPESWLHRQARRHLVCVRDFAALHRHRRAVATSSYARLSISSPSFRLCLLAALRWFVANISSNGRPLALQFCGQSLGLSSAGICWLFISADHHHRLGLGIPRRMRWICRQIAGTRREIVFNAAGLADVVANGGLRSGARPSSSRFHG